eukprot:TRINITY_DN2306_c0_g1_i2.p1 TRINITY_DN2306_c0_g1~~TRINITY_DN2306_c0_g1_i2.p1  ORF type:complete len:1006 (+),score=483.68 TRINITY_DN2306_c0_g1_i2:382-3018(+)
MEEMVEGFKKKLQASEREVKLKDEKIKEALAKVEQVKKKAAAGAEALAKELEQQKEAAAAAAEAAEEKEKELEATGKTEELEQELAAVKEELEAAKAAGVDKDAEIDRLQNEIEAERQQAEAAKVEWTQQEERVREALEAEIEDRTKDMVHEMQQKSDEHFEQKLELVAMATQTAAASDVVLPGTEMVTMTEIVNDEREKHTAELQQLEKRSNEFAKTIIQWVMETTKMLNPHVTSPVDPRSVRKEEDVLIQLPMLLTAITSVCDALKSASVNLVKAKKEAAGAKKTEESRAAWEDKLSEIITRSKAAPMEYRCDAIARMLKWQHVMKTMWEDRRHRLREDLENRLERVIAAPHEDMGYDLFADYELPSHSSSSRFPGGSSEGGSHLPPVASPHEAGSSTRTLSPRVGGPSTEYGTSGHFTNLPERAARVAPLETTIAPPAAAVPRSPILTTASAGMGLPQHAATAPAHGDRAAAPPPPRQQQPRQQPRRGSKPFNSCPLCQGRLGDGGGHAHPLEQAPMGALNISRVNSPPQLKERGKSPGDLGGSPMWTEGCFSVHDKAGALDLSLQAGKERTVVGGVRLESREGGGSADPNGTQESWMFSSRTGRTCTPGVEKVSSSIKKHLTGLPPNGGWVKTRDPPPSSAESGDAPPLQISSLGMLPGGAPPPVEPDRALPAPPQPLSHALVIAERAGVRDATPKDIEREAVQRRKTTRLQAEQLKMMKSMQAQELFRSAIIEERKRRQMEVHSSSTSKSKKPAATYQQLSPTASAALVDGIVAAHEAQLGALAGFADPLTTRNIFPPLRPPPAADATSPPLPPLDGAATPPDAEYPAPTISIPEVDTLLRTIQSAGGGAVAAAAKHREKSRQRPARKAVATA